MPDASTIGAASAVSVTMDTVEMDLPVKVNKNILSHRASLPHTIICLSTSGLASFCQLL